MSISAVHHLGLTVTDVDRSAKWYETVLGFERAGAYTAPDGARRKIFLAHADLGVRVGLTEHRGASRVPFDETQVGLDHLALRVDTEQELREWEQRLAGHGVTFTPSTAANSIPGAYVVVFRDPDNIQLELFFDPTAP
jgi:catechol 2,3-dioxygenase-like lactoylglutathione lyase family enzyme